jgi:hypothetical protein
MHASSVSRSDRFHWLARAGAALLLMALGVRADATELCVDTSAALQSALTFGAFQESDYTIKIVQGTYALDAAYVPFSAPTTLLGGYTANCQARSVNAANTTIDFGGGTGEFTLNQSVASPVALIAVDGLTFKHGGRLAFSAGATGQYSDDAGDVHLSNVRITDFTNTDTSDAPYLIPVKIDSHSGETLLQNVQMDHLVQLNTTTTCGIRLQFDRDSQVTVMNTSIDLAGSKQVCFDAFYHSGDYVVNVYNSILWGSDGGTPTMATVDDNDSANSFTIHVVNSLYNDPIAGPASKQIVAALHADPKWVNPAAGNYHLAMVSLAVNSGTLIGPVGVAVPATDIEGGPRWIGSVPDRGAYESPFNNATNFLVTTTIDSATPGSGSLRDAINQANSLANPATIQFAIPGGCPRLVTLDSLLPTITSPIIIDGYSQPGSMKNTSADAFTATLCVMLKPSSGTLSRAFAVPSGADGASLTLRGMALGGFGQPVQLLGGGNHVISGNQFGGTLAGVSLPGAGLYGVLIGINATGSLIVGGSNLADRNVIAGAAQGGINVQSSVISTPEKCQIVNNLIGLTPNGLSALPNFTGINLSGSGCSVIGNRIAGNTNDAIWINGGSNNLVQRNALGVTAKGLGFLNTGAGVRIGGGSGNVVGTAASSSVSGTLFANTIRFMGAGGVIVASGINNAVRSNLIYDNGSTGDGLDIELGNNGPTVNDGGDADSGANNLQNFPLVSGLYYADTPAPNDTDVPATVGATLNAQAGAYRIDAYFSNRCDNGAFHVLGRGHADAYAGTGGVTLPAGGGTTSFSMKVNLANVQSDGFVSLTATDTLGNTSEIGSCFSLNGAQLDRIFANGVEAP